MRRLSQQLNRVLVFAEIHGSLSDRLAATEVREASRSKNDEMTRKLLSLRDSVSGDCYMGEDWELETIDSLINAITEREDGHE